MKLYISMIRSKKGMKSLTVETRVSIIKGLMNSLPCKSKLFVDHRGYSKFFVYSDDLDVAYHILWTIIQNGGVVRHGKISDWLSQSSQP